MNSWKAEEVRWAGGGKLRGKAHLELLPHLQVVVVGEVASKAMNLDARVLVLRDELEGDGHEAVLLKRGDLARMRTGYLDLRIGLTDDVHVRDRAKEVLSVAVDRDAARRTVNEEQREDVLKTTYRTTRKSVSGTSCLNMGARMRLLYRVVTV